MTKEMVKAQSNEVGFIEGDLSAWGSNESSASDIVIPKIQLMQGMSDMVVKGAAKLGDYIDSVTKEVIGGVDKPLVCVPFHMEKFNIIQKYNGKKFEYVSIEKCTSANENAPYEFEGPKGEKMKRVHTKRFYVMIEGNVLPYTIDFASTSSKAGKELATEMFVKNAIMKLPPAASKIAIGSAITKNDDGTYAVKTIKVVGKSSKEEIAMAFDWYKTVSKKAQHIDPAGDF